MPRPSGLTRSPLVAAAATLVHHGLDDLHKAQISAAIDSGDEDLVLRALRMLTHAHALAPEETSLAGSVAAMAGVLGS